MIKIEHVEIYGWEAAVRGMRNPKNSWDTSDSGWDWVEGKSPINSAVPGMCFVIGKKDMNLMQTLVKAGTDHGKFMRMIGISMDITAPLYWWKEFDTYKVGTVANSCSTMHKIASKEFDVNDFSHEHVEELEGDEYNMSYDYLIRTVDILNHYRQKYNVASGKLRRELTVAERKHALAQQKLFWWQMIQLLPSSYNQRRTVMLNYAVARNQYHARKAHKLDEWHDYCHVLEKLPYSELITMDGKQQ